MATTLDKAGLEQLWVQAGGDPAKANVAAAVALAESGGRQDATNHNTDGSIDRGYWQINSVHGAQSTTAALANAKAAVAISSNGTDWTPWTTFKTGAYKQFLAGGPATPPSPGTSPGSASTSSSSSGGVFTGQEGGLALKALLWVALVAVGVYLAYRGLRLAFSARSSS